ncbi:EKC/KEOPS complex subunit LAGE3-like [Pteropus medius]|uniref:EKC/KEOPS complex subunit LAGE3-like n=1 Tax=Pteropus vampyrus TaxID=132908 RepID=UPI00196A8E14|nr:EKC/KEOPS complex subunit LAGE3-like [Pteropus giganteus]
MGVESLHHHQSVQKDFRVYGSILAVDGFRSATQARRFRRGPEIGKLVIREGDFPAIGTGSSDHAKGGACARGNEGGPVFPDDQRVLGAHDGQGGAGARDDPRGPDAQYEQAGHRGLGGPGVEERVGSAAVGADNVARAACASGSDGDAARDDVGPENRPLVFTITVPFGSHLVAEMARRAMDVESLHHHQSVQKDFRVYGSILAVRWIADEPGPLQESVNSFFQLLSLLL